MKITPIGAAGREVTASCYSVRTMNTRILVDCGRFQGGKKSEALNKPRLVPNRKFDAVILTYGEDAQRAALAKMMAMGEVIDLSA